MACYVGIAVCECGATLDRRHESMMFVSGSVAKFQKEHKDLGHHVLNAEELAEHIMRETGAGEIVVKSVGMSSFGIEQLSHGCIDIEAEDGRYFRNLSAIWRRPPVAGERVRVWPGGFEIVGRDRGFTDDVWEAHRPH